MTTSNNLASLKNKALALILFSTAVSISACDKKSTSSEQLDAMQTKTADLAQDMRDYTFAERDEFVVKMRSQLADLNRDLDELAAKIKSSTAAVKADAQPRIDALREQSAHLNRQLDEATNTTASGWDKFKAEVRNTNEASKQDFKRARQWLSDKIAP